MITDIMYIPAGGNQIMIAEGTDSIGYQFKSKPFTDYLIPNSEDPTCMNHDPSDIFSEPHSNAFVDLDGDCMPDIFL